MADLISNRIQVITFTPYGVQSDSQHLIVDCFIVGVIFLELHTYRSREIRIRKDRCGIRQHYIFSDYYKRSTKKKIEEQ